MATSPASAFPLVKKLRRPIQALWILGLFLLLASPIATRFKFLTFLEELTLDLRFAVRGEVEPSPGDPPIVLVGIDDSSLEPNLGPLDLASDPWLAEFANSWPWPRSLQGELLRRLLADGARSVAFDVLFYQEGTGDEVFAEELTQAGPRAVLATQWVPVKDPGAIWSYRERLPSDSILPNPYFTQLGFVNIKPDKDGVVRKIVLTTDLAHETLAFTQNAEKAARLETLSRRLPDLPAFSLATAQSSAETFTPPFPLETGKAYRINYAGRSEWFPTLSAIDFFLPDRRDAAASLVRDAMVIIAPMSDHLKDNHPTPLGVSYGAEIHAHALRNLFLDNFLQEPGTGGRAIWLGALSLLTAGAILLPKSVGRQSGLLLTLLAGWLIAAQLAFSLGDFVLPLASGLLLLLTTGGGLLLYGYLLEQMERKQIRRYLNHYVSPGVTRILLEEGGGFERLRKGEVRPVSLLFSDIRGFTAASENRHPSELSAQLNEYFDEMVGSIFDTDGSLNKYIGDAIFAVWGDLYPRGKSIDAGNALKAALLMRKGLRKLNQQWASEPNRLPFSIGIGLHQGDAFIGNLGHPGRLEVAVMGEAVNMASRIESATKFYGTDILLSEDTVQAAGDPKGLMYVDRALLSGSSKPMNLFHPITTDGDPDAANWVARWNQAVDDYQQQRFQQALDSFESLTEAPHKIRELYLRRCQDRLHTPHQLDWTPLQKVEK